MEDQISIIIPVYNCENTLNRCLNSIINQTYKNLQIILVESASDDNSPQICDNYSDSDNRIIVIHQKERYGLSNARNTGLKYATGTYIGFVDSDDWVDLNMYKLLCDLITRYDADIAVGKVVRAKEYSDIDIQGDDDKVAVYSNDEYARLFFKIRSNRIVHYVWNKLYKAEIARKMVFPEGLIGEDVEGFFKALLNSKKIVEINKTVYFYWQNDEGLSSEWFSTKQMDLIKIWKDVNDLCKSSNNKSWYQYADFAYYRCFFGMLTRLMVSGKSKNYPNEKKYLIEKTKKYYSVLMKSSLPMNRKILMSAMCFNFDFCERFFKLFDKFLRRKLRQRV